MLENKYTESVLPNGIRLIHKEKPGEIAHLVLMVETGTRDELAHENGLAHFVEHTIFKGTQNRKAYHILSCLDNVGGDLNAFTTKEETCIQATFLKQHYKRSLDLFADIAFHSTFPENELAKEKEVILDEINSYLDSPSDEIYDLFEEMVFNGHPLARNILGTTELVKGFHREDILIPLDDLTESLHAQHDPRIRCLRTQFLEPVPQLQPPQDMRHGCSHVGCVRRVDVILIGRLHQCCSETERKTVMYGDRTSVAVILFGIPFVVVGYPGLGLVVPDGELSTCVNLRR